MVDKRERKELKEIRKETNKPKDEEIIVPIITNKGEIKDRKITQHRINIPKKFAKQINLNSKDYLAKVSLIKGEAKERSIKIEIIKK